MTETTNNSETIKPAGEVRQWRVGTVSMGLILVALGIVLLLGRLNDTLTISNLLRFWPLVLIILGVEMVLLNVLMVFKGSRIRFTYDVLSIFLVMLLLFVSSALIALESTGVLDLAHRALQISQRNIESEKVLYTVDETLKVLSIRVEGGRKANLISYDGKEVKVLVTYNGRFISQEEGLQYAQDQFVRSERMGDTLYLAIYPPGQGYPPNTFVDQEVLIFIPQNLDVELNQLRGDLEITLRELKSNWIIDHQATNRNLSVMLESTSNTKLVVEVTGQGKLLGNIQWDSEITQNEPGKPAIEAIKTWGDAQYSLVISQTGGTTVANTR